MSRPAHPTASATPPIRYARTADGLRIAFYTVGQGPACVVLFAYHVSHLELNWQVTLHRRGIEFLAQHFTVVVLDLRGAGLSERRIDGLSLECFNRDIEAVLAALRLDRVAMVAMGPSAPIALKFAKAAADRVTSIVFIQAGESEANKRLLSLRAVNPEVEARLRGVLIGGDDSANAAALAAAARASLDAHVLKQWERVLAASGAATLASGVVTPTLFLHATDDDVIPLEAGRELAGLMTNSKLLTLAESHPMQIWGNGEALDAMVSWIAAGFGVRLRPRGRGRRKVGGASSGAALTEREIAVLRLLAAGKTNRQIAAELFISTNTVSHHLRNIFAKTASTNRTEAAAFAHANGLSRGTRRRK
jgi:DNA-binding CsgD family transcriptional regulator/pimeloyl-ACP methyl ester carboxylesterase